MSPCIGVRPQRLTLRPRGGAAPAQPCVAMAVVILVAIPIPMPVTKTTLLAIPIPMLVA